MERDEKAGDEAWRTFMAQSGEAEPPPPARLRQTLRDRGLLAPMSARSTAARTTNPAMHGVPRALVAIAAVMLVFLSGLWAGRRTAPAPVDPGADRYALFVLGEGRSDVEEARIVREYGAWLRGLAADGIGVSGEKLGNAAWTLDPDGGITQTGVTGPEEDRVTGFFIIAAPTADSALAIARGMPHLGHGGRLLLRPIEPT